MQELAKRQAAGDKPYDAIVSVSAFGNTHSVQTLGHLLALAKPGASVTVQEPVASSPTEVPGVSKMLCCKVITRLVPCCHLSGAT